jgi:hypothetical protein
MLAVTAAAVAVVSAVVAVVVGMTVVVQMLVVMGVCVVVGVGMGVLMGMGMTVVAVLMGVGMGMLVAVGAAVDVIVIDMHSNFSFSLFSFYYTRTGPSCQNIYFFGNIPPPGLRREEKWGIMQDITKRRDSPWKTISTTTIMITIITTTTMPISMPTALPTPTVMSTKIRKRWSTGCPGPSGIWKR